MFTDTDLVDPAPPVPGATERAKVATRATQIKRNRRFAAAGGALGVVAVLSLGAVAVSGGSSGSGTSRVEVAGASVDREPATTAAPVATTLAPVPVTEAPAVDNSQASTQEAPAVQETPAPAPTFTVSGTIPGYPAGVSGSVRLMGDGGTFTATVNADGSFSVSGVPAGTYDASYAWQSTDGAAQVGRTTVTISGDGSVAFG